MSRADVIVATFAMPQMAKAACKHLQGMGIAAYVLEDTASSPLASAFGLGGRIVIYVAAADYQRAAKILEETTNLPNDPDTASEEEEEADEDLWLCSLCGEPLSETLVQCPGCGTARAATEPPKSEWAAWNRPPRARSDHIKEGPPTETSLGLETDIEVPPLTTLHGDKLASRTIKVALLSFFILPLGIWYYGLLLELVCYEGEFSPAGQRNKYIAMALGVVQMTLFISICLSRF